MTEQDDGLPGAGTRDRAPRAGSDQQQKRSQKPPHVGAWTTLARCANTRRHAEHGIASSALSQGNPWYSRQRIAATVLFCLSVLIGCKGYKADQQSGGTLFEVCDGEDNDGDGRVDEGFDIESPCVSLGECGPGVVECAGPFGTRCSTGPDGSASRVSPEVCDTLDNDCDGERDEGFGIGEACALPGGCVGVRACAEADNEPVCIIDELAVSDEVCDGLDNDCDGYVDYTVEGVDARSVCQCVEERLSFGAMPGEGSTTTNESFCNGARPTCVGENGELTMSFCLRCEDAPYALCVSGQRMDLTPFVAGGNRALTVRFSFESETDVKSLVNLYYHIDHPAEPEPLTVRRYFRLLDIGDGPGTYTKTFFPQETCLAGSEVRCAGSETACPACRANDTCGTPTGSACEDLSFQSAQLQLAVEDGCPDGTFAGVLRIHEVSFGPVPCEE